MVKLKPDEMNKFISYMDKHKGKFGLGDYKIGMKPVVPKRDTPVAETTIDRFEKELGVELSSEFMKSTDKRKRNVLIHELIHARVLIQKWRIDDSVEKIRNEFEEEMVNDITTGFESVLGETEW